MVPKVLVWTPEERLLDRYRTGGSDQFFTAPRERVSCERQPDLGTRVAGHWRRCHWKSGFEECIGDLAAIDAR
jgi:hypothetical protein